MNFYTKPHRFYCGVDLHARTMSVCVFDQAGQVVFEKTFAAEAALFLQHIAPFRDDLVVCCECLILIMVSLGMGRGLSQGYTGSKLWSFGPSVGFSGRV